jgi:inorganic pyrophosphatase
MLNTIIDTPKGSRCTFKYEEKTKLFQLNKLLPPGTTFPYNLGFIPLTRDEDGDALAVLLLMDEAIFPGCVVPIELVGVLGSEITEITGEVIRCERLVGTPKINHVIPDIRTLDELDVNQLEAIECFFISYSKIDGRQYRPTGRFGPNKAEALVKEGIWRYDYMARNARNA